jgi:AraC-like DNA-binding protein
MTPADSIPLPDGPRKARQASPAQAFWRDADMPFVESRRACESRACYKPHHHPTFSIGAVDAGYSLFSGASDGPVTLRPGTLVFVPAARVHACNPALGTAWSYQMLHLDADWRQAVRQEYLRGAPRQVGPCRAASRPSESRHTGPDSAEPVHIVADPALYARFCQLNMLLFSDAQRQDKEAALIAFIGDCDTQQGLTIDAPSALPHLAEHIQPALAWLRAQCDAPITLEALAQRVDMSRYQLIRAFRAVTGMTPHAWQLNQRINLARTWIQRGDSMSAVAQHLGFADQAHFQRVFKAYAGVTPGRFRA